MNSRYTYAASNVPGQRKSRAEGKLSYIPMPKFSNRGSCDRLSETGRRPGRPRSLETPRAGVPTNRPSRVLSATKVSSVQRTPSSDRSARSWLNSLERALAFVTGKDKRPITNAKWQNETMKHVNSELVCRGEGSGGAPLVKPLTITRFVDITATLLSCLMENVRLDSSNYVTKLPHLTKRLLYPGNVSKSWLKTVNTLHTYPSALALISYLLDLVRRVERPIDMEAVYAERDQLSQLRRAYLVECWGIFNKNSDDFSSVDEVYIQDLKQLLGDVDEKEAEILAQIQGIKEQLNDPSERVARADEQRRREQLTQLQENIRSVQSARIQNNAQMDAMSQSESALIEENQQFQAENERLQQELEHMKKEVSAQPLSTAERAVLLDKVDYSNRVIESKNELLEQVSKMLHQTESDLALSQKQCLNACVEYNQQIISLTAKHSDCAGLAIEESDLMKSDTLQAARASVETLRAKFTALADALRDAERTRAAEVRRLSEGHYQLNQITAQLDEIAAEADNVKASIRTERDEAAAERDRCAREIAETQELIRKHEEQIAQLAAAEIEVQEMRKEHAVWEKNIGEMIQYVSEQRALVPRKLEEARKQRTDALERHVMQWHQQLKQINARYSRK